MLAYSGSISNLYLNSNSLKNTLWFYHFPCAEKNYKICITLYIAAGPTENCPSGASACFHESGHIENFGEANDEVKLDSDGNLYLEYTTGDTTAICQNTAPKTTITFVCPHRGLVSNHTSNTCSRIVHTIKGIYKIVLPNGHTESQTIRSSDYSLPRQRSRV